MPKIIEDEQIYRAVMQVVSERGYVGATTKQMAEAAHVSELTLFRKYDNKAQLVKQAISFIVEQTDFVSAAQYTGDIHADLLRVVQAYQDTAVKHGLFFAALFSEFSRHPELEDSMGEPLTIFHAIGELIAHYQSNGKLEQEHPTLAVAALLGPLMYASMMSNAILDNQIPPLDLSKHVTRFLEGHHARSIQRFS